MRLLAAAVLLCACRQSEPATRAEVAPRPAPPAAALADAADAPRGRPLTRAERELIQPIFKGGLDYDSVRVIPERFIAFQPANVYMSPEGNIYAPGRLYREDFAAASVHPHLRAVFVHECLHVWQHQSGMNLLAGGVSEFVKRMGDYEKAYAYTLLADRDLLDYGLEQQASIVEDYHLIHHDGLSPQRLENRLEARARDTLYGRVLGRFLEDPRYARAAARDEVARRHEKLAAETPPGAPGCEESQVAHEAEHLCGWRFEPH